MASAAGGEKPKSGMAPGADVENPASVPVITSAVSRWRREGFLEKAALVLRVLGSLFSALAFLVMASNRHGDWRQFNKYQEYRYLVAISALAFLYTAAQVVRQVLRLAGRSDTVWTRAMATADFAGDQVFAYLLMSALSAAVPITNRMREGADNSFTDASAASISMAFFAFASLALSALVSGFKISRQS
uniref:CASP-like protein n=1 Tax=Anthurium amnicola TaxID=1678845 RepID=A0A1D1YS11_9ARAE